MRAAVLSHIGEPLAQIDVDLDDTADDEVLIEVRASGVCHSDVSVANADYGYPLPLIPGHEVAGVVLEAGIRATGIDLGDHVVTCLAASCGECRMCLLGRGWACVRRPELRRPPGAAPRLSVDGVPVEQFAGIGGFAERVLVHHKNVVTVIDAVPFDRAALLGCCVVTGVGAAMNAASIRAAETVAVVGCGGVGLNVIQGARLRGAAAIVAVDTDARKLELAGAFGATHVVDASRTDPVAAVRAQIGGGVDHAFEVVGRPETVQQVYAMLGRTGHGYCIGMQQPQTMVTISASEMTRESKSLQGVHMGAGAFKVDIPYYADLYARGQLELDLLIAERIDLSDVNRAMADIGATGGARSVIVS